MRARRWLAGGMLAVCAWPGAAPAGDGIPVPVRPPAETLARPAAPLEVSEVRLRSDEGKALAAPLDLAEGRAYDWSVVWRVPAMAVGGAYRLSVRLDISGPVVESESPVSWAGSAPGACAGRLDIPPVTGSGRAVLRVVLLPGEVSDRRDPGWVLALIPATVAPCAADSRITSDRIQEVFGAGACPLGKRVRLGPGASVDLAVPDASVSFSRIAVVSSVGWLPRQERRRADQTIAVLQVMTADAVGAPETFPLRLGRETLQTDHHLFAREKAMERRELPVFSTWTTGDGGRRSNYIAEFGLPSPRRVSAVRVSHSGSTGVLLLDEVVLLP